MTRLPSGDTANVVIAEKFASGGIRDTQSGASVVWRKNRTAATNATVTASVNAPSAASFHRFETGAAMPLEDVGVAARTHSRAPITSAADCQRLSGSFARHF